jgi:PAS domain S-box-containing protein
MSKRFVNPALFGTLCLIFLIWQLSVPALAQTKPQVASAAKNIPVQGSGATESGPSSDLSRKNVLILHTFAYDTSAYLVMDPIFLKGFTDAGLDASNLHFEFLDLLRHRNQAYRRETAEYLRRKFTDQPIDLIIALHRTALSYLLEDGKGLFPRVPVINVIADPDWLREDFRTANEHRLQELKRPSVIMPLAIGTEPTVKNILTLLPETRSLVVISGSDLLDRLTEQSVRHTLEAWHGRLQVEYLSGLPLEEVLERVSALAPKTAILYTVFGADTKGRTYRNYDVLRKISRAANAPIFGLYDTLLGDGGIVGGTMPLYSVEAAKTVRLALEIVRGKLPSKPLTIIPAPLVPMFDWLQLKRWGFRESALPAGAMILNKSVSPWERYKFYISATVAFCLLETVLIIFLIAQRHRKKVAEELLRRKSEELDQFFNVSQDLLCIANTDGYFLRLNPAWEKVFGYAREELMAKRFLDFVHPDDLLGTQEAVSAQATQQKVIHIENRYRCKDGTYRWLEWSSAPAGKLLYVAARDITEHKRAEETLEERLRFERLLSHLSARFVNIPPDRVDSEIDYGLRQILEFLQVDRAGLMRSSPDRSTYQITHGVYSGDVPPVPVGVELPRFIHPWAYEKLVEKHEVVSFSKLDDLPPEANVDKQKYAEWGIRSGLDIPIITGGSVVHVIVINSVKNERIWPEELFPRLQLLGEIFVNALERKQIRLQIEERLRFEGLISNLSASFVNLPPDEVDSKINKGLRSVTEFFDADRCTIGLFSEDGTQLLHAFEYHAAEAEPTPESISKEQMPWYVEQLIWGKPVVMNRVEDWPPEAEKERQVCLARGMKSVLSIPMVSGGISLGSCALVSTRAERVWPEELVRQFQLLTEVFGNALQRRKAEEASRKGERILRQNENDLRRLAGRLIYAQEEERSRLARELHDDLAQRLAVFAIDVGKLEQQWVNPPALAREQLREMEKNIFKISQDVHSLSRQLHPSILDDLGLIKAVESECMNFSRREGIEIVFNHENIPTGIPKDVSLSLYRIIQEGLNNISKHACAEHISVSLKGIGYDVLLSVQDDGIGFDSAEVKEKPGLGFSSMRERARLIHGELSIQSQPEKGTLITLRVPLTKEEE